MSRKDMESALKKFIETTPLHAGMTRQIFRAGWDANGSRSNMYAELWQAQVQLAESLIAERNRYREALERIANRDRYGTTGHWVYGDCGKIAREELEAGE